MTFKARMRQTSEEDRVGAGRTTQAV